VLDWSIVRLVMCGDGITDWVRRCLRLSEFKSQSILCLVTGS